MARRQAAPDWAKIAAFYAGRPIRFEFRDLPAGLGGTTGPPESGDVFLSRDNEQSLKDFVKYLNDPGRGTVLGIRGITTLLHEAIHNRGGMESSGLKGAAHEAQAKAFGGELVGDMLQRFFGIPIDSKLSKQYQAAAKKYNA